MNLQAEKLMLIEQLTKIQDAKLVADIKNILDNHQKEIIGYADGGELSEEDVLDRIKVAESRIANGQYLSHKEVEKESEDW